MAVYEIIFKGNGKKTLDVLRSMSKSLSKINSQTKKYAVTTGGVIKAMTGHLAKATGQTKRHEKAIKHLQKVPKHLSKIKKAGEWMVKPFVSAYKQFSYLKSKGVETSKALMMGFKAFGVSTYRSFLLATKGVLVFTAAISVIAVLAVAILSIVAVIKVLKIAWNMNIGGMQTKWNRFMGKALKTFSVFKVMLMKGLKAAEPFITIIVDGLFKGLGLAFQGLVDAFKIIFNMFSKWKENEKRMENLRKGAILLKGIFIGLGKVLGVVFKGLALVLMGIYETVMFIVDAVFAVLDKLADWGLMDKIEVGSKDSPGTQASSGNSINNANNQQDNRVITIMTNKEITQNGAQGFKDIVGRQTYLGL